MSNYMNLIFIYEMLGICSRKYLIIIVTQAYLLLINQIFEKQLKLRSIINKLQSKS